MYLYQFEALTDTDRLYHVVVAAPDDETAFLAVDVEIEKHCIRMPTMKEITLLEKKKTAKTSGFVIDSTSGEEV